MKERRKFLTAWVTPVAVAVSLPRHANATPGPIERPFNVSFSSHTCDDSGATSVASFVMCNDEPDAIKITEAGFKGSVTVIDPSIPFTLGPGECSVIDMQGGAINPFVCNGQFGISFAVESITNGDFGVVSTTIKNS